MNALASKSDDDLMLLLSTKEKELLDRLERFDLSFATEKLITEGRLTVEEIPYVVREFRRFMALAGFGVFPLAMIGPRVDELWHQLILFTKKYEEFCLSTVGRFIEHQPDTPSTPIPVEAGENFRSAYRKYFGDIPAIWFKGMSPATSDYYKQAVLVGRPPTAWSGWAGPDL
jgi:hypothetical protein